MSVNSTKITAAFRLICAAIEMYRQNIDRAATLVVAASALNLLRELLSKRGPSFETLWWRQIILLYAEGVNQGRKIPDHFAVAGEAIAFIAEAIEDGHISSMADVDLHIPRQLGSEWLNPIYGPYNFLKHADRDPEALLSEEAIEAGDAILLAIHAYELLFPGEVPPSPLPEFLNLWRERNEEHRAQEHEGMDLQRFGKIVQQRPLGGRS